MQIIEIVTKLPLEVYTMIRTKKPKHQQTQIFINEQIKTSTATKVALTTSHTISPSSLASTHQENRLNDETDTKDFASDGRR
jgi:hypothetical protein